MNNPLKSWLPRRRPQSRGRRNSRLRSRLVPAQLETLEDRALLSAITARLTIYSDGSPIDIPADLGVSSGTPVSQIHTVDASGNICIEPIGSGSLEDQTLGDFFEMWRTNAGDPGNNSDAVFSSTQLFTSTTDYDNTIQVFVNGEINKEYDSYVIQAQDEIVIVFGGDPVVSINTNLGPVVIELFEIETPGTVDNFLNYINDGDYINSFFHRSDPGFVVQGGGFTTSSTEFTSTSQFTPVPIDPPILNEPFFSNTRGTIAMAKGSDPNSATSQFFVNLGDNSSLDLAANGSFTVFGQVLDMTTVDEIETLGISNFGIPFNELPLTDSNQLVVVSSIAGLGTISGQRFEDVNADGVFDVDDIPLANAVVYIDANTNGVFDSGEISATTDNEGRYRIDVEPGTYTVRAVVSPGQTLTIPASGEYIVSVEIGADPTGRDFGETSIQTPTAVDLADAADTGVSQTDNLTSLNNGTSQSTLEFLVSGVLTGATVEILADGIVIGSAIATSESVTIITDGSSQLPEGTHDITATQTLQSATSSATGALTIDVDSTAPGDFTVLPPATIPVNTAFTIDIESPDELDAQYLLLNEPTGMSIDSTGQLTWTPTLDQALPHEFRIHLTDAAGNTLIADVAMTVLTDVPAVPDDYAINENTTLTVAAALGVLANDGPAANGTLAAQIVSQPTHGTVTLNSDGSFEYVPDTGFFGTDAFSYRALDGAVPTNVAKASITIHPANALPVGVDDQYGTDEDIPLNVNSTDGVLNNDTDPDNDNLAATVLINPENGVLTLNSNGSFVYTPNLNFFGTDSFTYELSDDQDVSSDSVTVTLTVNAVNDQPSAETDSYTLDEDTPLITTEIDGVLSNDTDVDDEHSTLVASIVSEPLNGSLNFEADGSFTYTPNDNFFGSDQFTYFTSDGTDPSLTVLVSLTVNSQPDTPSANADRLTALANSSSIFLDVLANDSSVPDGTQPLVVIDVSAGSSGGTLRVTGSGDGVLYTPPTSFRGTETFTYTIEDSDGLTATATATVETTLPAGTTESSLRGVVYVDANRNGIRDAHEFGIPGVEIQLSGTTDSDEVISTTFITDNEGEWEFTSLEGGTYQIAETQPTAFVDASSSAGNSGGDDASSNSVSNIVLNGLNSATEINFGESHMTSKHASIAWRFASSFADGFIKDLMANIEESADRLDLADSIRISIDEADNNANTGGAAPNIFTIDESAANGTTVGVVTAATTFSAPLIYEFIEVTTPGELQLLPDDHLSGDLTASVVLIEYLDFQCPECATAHSLVSQLEQDFAGDVLVVRRHYPLTTIHDNAFAAARAAEAAGRQGMFEELGDLLYANQADWQSASDPQTFFETYANQLGLEITQFRSDMNDTTVDDRINRDFDTGTGIGVFSTPTFYLNGTAMPNPVTQAELNAAVQAEVDALDSAFAVHHTNGNLVIRDTSLLDAHSSPTVIVPVNVTDTNGLQEQISVTVQVTDNASAAGPVPGDVDSIFSEPNTLLSAV